MKFGKVKKQHGRILGLDELLQILTRGCAAIQRIVPGRISRRKGNSGHLFRIQYATGSGLKCLYSAPGTVQEVFLVCSDTAEVQRWLQEQRLVAGPEDLGGELSP